MWWWKERRWLNISERGRKKRGREEEEEKTKFRLRRWLLRRGRGGRVFQGCKVSGTALPLPPLPSLEPRDLLKGRKGEGGDG